VGEAKRRKKLDPNYGRVRNLDSKTLLVPFVKITPDLYDPSAGLAFEISSLDRQWQSRHLSCYGTVDPCDPCGLGHPAMLGGFLQELSNLGQIFAFLQLCVDQKPVVDGLVLAACDESCDELPDGLTTIWLTDTTTGLTWHPFLTDQPLLEAAIHEAVLRHSQPAVAHGIAYQKRNRLVI
jgi:hypothetical protein